MRSRSIITAVVTVLLVAGVVNNLEVDQKAQAANAAKQ